MHHVYYSYIKSEMLFAGKWMELEVIRSSEISQNQKDIYHVFTQTKIHE
jgi:hypothetical protein